MNRRWKRTVTGWADTLGLLALLEQAERWRPDVLRVIAYHRVDDTDSPLTTGMSNLLSATPAQFTAQMRFLARRYRVVSAQQAVEALAGRAALPPRAVLLTFDDGYTDFRDHAWPVLKALGLPATLFVATAYPGDPRRLFWWDRLYQGLTRTERREITVDGLGTLPLATRQEQLSAWEALSTHVVGLEHAAATALVDHLVARLGVTARRDGLILTWDDLRALAAEGVTIAPHTRTHPILSRLPAAAQQAEIVGSREDLERHLGHTLPLFCYPDGRAGTFDRHTVDILQRSGFVAAFTTLEGVHRLGHDRPLVARRLNTGPETTMARFRLHLTAAYAAYKNTLRSLTCRFIGKSNFTPGGEP